MKYAFRYILSLVCVFLSVVTPCSADDLCMDGTLLFREDFGGNSPDDPRVVTTSTPVPGMMYDQLLDDAFGSMRSGVYLLTKQGYCNGDTLPSNPYRGSQWHLQDDHTYPGDLTRGYLMEIDGRGDNAAFYTKTIEGLCEGTTLTFSAYVANVMTWGQYVGSPGKFAYPRLKFVLTNPADNSELKTYDTGDIPFDSTFMGDYQCWQYSSKWHLVGMTFTLPEGVNRVKMTIYNNASGTTGNDFAIDDIEIRLCVPPVTIEGEHEICANETATLTANFTNDGTFEEPLAYKWWHSTDSLNWTELSETTNTLTIPTAHKTDAGWYQVAVADNENIEHPKCRAVSEPFLLNIKECVEELCMDGTLLFREDFGGNSPSDPDISTATVPGMDPRYTNSGNSLGSGHYTLRKEGWLNGIQWHRQDDHTYFGDKTRGYLLEVDGMGGEAPFYSKTIDGLCAGSTLTFSAYVVNVHYAGQLDYFGSRYVYPRMKFVLKDPTTGEVLATKSTGDIQPDWRYGTPETWQYARENSLSAEWQLIGMHFTVPEGVESIQMYIYNDVEQNGSGNDFALDDIEIHLCLPPVKITSPNEVCENEPYTFEVEFENDGSMPEPLEYQWYFSPDSLQWTALENGDVRELSFTQIAASDAGWYKIAVAGSGNIDRVNCRAMSEPFRLFVKECTPPAPKYELCEDNRLLFREDFGGNSPDDPESATTPVPGMDSRYQLGANCYLTKKGKRNSSVPDYSLWHIQDDHSYEDDYTRGYFLAIDGLGNNIPFYSTLIEGLCEGSEMNFSAHVVNLTTANQIVIYRNKGVHYAYPQIRMVLTNPEDGAVLAVQEMDTIGYDWSLYNVSDAWKYSAHWQRMGMTFTVPAGVDAIRLTIDNFVTDYSGNDFAVDDIEIHICLPPVKIVSPDSICEKDPYMFEVEFENDGSMPEPLEYQWYFSPDSLQWTALENGNVRELTFAQIAASDSGWYKITVAGSGNIGRPNCRAESEPFRLNVEQCDRCAPIIVNKYNWVLLVDNVTVRELFSDRTVLAYQWYKNGEPIAGANDDDYSEQNELHGTFQMFLTLDGGEEICSNIIELAEEPEETPVASMRLYNSNGRLLREWETTDINAKLVLPQGIYFLRIEQAEEVFTRKICIP